MVAKVVLYWPRIAPRPVAPRMSHAHRRTHSLLVLAHRDDRSRVRDDAVLIPALRAQKHRHHVRPDGDERDHDDQLRVVGLVRPHVRVDDPRRHGDRERHAQAEHAGRPEGHGGPARDVLRPHARDHAEDDRGRHRENQQIIVHGLSCSEVLMHLKSIFREANNIFYYSKFQVKCQYLYTFHDTAYT